MFGSVILGILTSIMIGTSVIVPNQIYYCNENHIQMTKSEYEQLQILGFDKSEIETMDIDKFQKLTSMEIIKTHKEESVLNYDEQVDTVGNTVDSNEYSNKTIIENIEYSDEELLLQNGVSQEEMDLAAESEIDETEFYENIETNSISTCSYVSSNNEKQYSTSDATKTMITYVSYVKVDNEYKIYVKQNVNWTSVPENRFSDILAVNYTDNLRVAEKDGYPDVEMHLKYTQHRYSKVGWKHKRPKYKVTTKDVDNDLQYLGDSQTAYNHKIGEYFAFKFDLPQDTYTNGSSQRYYSIRHITHKNFYVSLEAIFETNNSSITGTEMQSHYVHQTGSGQIDWGKLTFTSSAPYITYSTDFWKDDPTFEQALYNRIYLKFEG